MAIADVAVSTPGKRIAAIDTLRGVAIAGMVVYHFSWDLWAFGLTSADVAYGPYWRLFAHTIATTFLVLVGVGLVLATRNGLSAGPFLRRLGLIAAGALAVTIATWVTDPSTFVFFGILHLIAVATVLAVPFLRLPAWLTAIAAIAAIALGNLYVSPLFNPPWLVWTGLATQVPDTVDYYPLFPWFGVVLAGIVAGKLFVDSPFEAAIARWQPADPVTRFLALAGRWSLWIYLIHQVILFEGVAFAAPFLAPVPPPPVALPATDPGQSYMNECLPACGAQGQGVSTCTTYCACMAGGLAGTDLLTTPAEQFSADQRTRLSAISKQCAAAITGQ